MCLLEWQLRDRILFGGVEVQIALELSSYDSRFPTGLARYAKFRCKIQATSSPMMHSVVTMRRVLLPLLLLCIVSQAALADAEIFIVRHAEKEDAIGSDKDSELSDAGRNRAESLARMLRDAGVTAVYATEFKRTQQTAELVARAARMKVTVMPAQETEALVSNLREAKGNALVVAHSNTIPAIIKALGVDSPVSVGETDYDNVFVVVRDPHPRLLRLHY